MAASIARQTMRAISFFPELTRRIKCRIGDEFIAVGHLGLGKRCLVELARLGTRPRDRDLDSGLFPLIRPLREQASD
jgi:hypothetical protein